MPRINHLHLHVRSVERSRAFYEKYFGLRDHVMHGDILFMRDADDGLDLALAPASTLDPFPEWFHFGFRLEAADAVAAMHARLRADAVETTELQRFDDFVVFRCHDPDGYQLEVYWE
jgi:catechol 2,3-dioxygenase-like lactoylglutathione lyase family enzyme